MTETAIPKEPDQRPLLRVLYAEDNPELRNVFLALLKESKYGSRIEATPVSNGLEALDKVRQAKEDNPNKTAFDIVISDRHMPEMDGPDAIKAIREIDPGVVTIILSSDTGGLDEKTRQQYGIDFVCFKGKISISEINSLLQQILEKREERVNPFKVQ